MKFGLLFLQIAALASAQDFDLIIRGGRIVDGTGDPAFLGDVAVRQGKIAAMGLLVGKTAARRIDPTGLTASPGALSLRNTAASTPRTCGRRVAASLNPWRRPSRSGGAPRCRSILST